MQKPKSYEFIGDFMTDFRGYNKLANFYNFASKLKNERIILDFKKMRWFDANLSALFAAMLFKLSTENGITFLTNYELIKRKFDVLIRNQFFNDDETIKDSQESTFPLSYFRPNEKDRFVECIDNLLLHKGLPKIEDEKKLLKLKSDLIEILCNINLHARTELPFFVCGQYYPKNKFFILTITDLGVGFLEPIKNFTNNKVDCHKDAISWALLGNSSKSDYTPGGTGVKGIYDYCKESNGIFNIASGNAFWGSNYEGGALKGFADIKYPFCGTTINLFFSWN